MTNRIPQEIIDDILNRLDIVDVIESHLPLKRSGNEFSARCPFHEEKTPSFTVSRQKQFYHCFGCGAHGTAISFLMEHLGITFIEAIEDLAGRSNISIPNRGNSDNETSNNKLFETLEFARRFYGVQLRQSDSRKNAVNYLLGRGISGESAKLFGLGYAPEGWRNLLDAHSSKGFESSLLLKAGLVARSDSNLYDRLRARIVFPIRDRRGRVIGFGGRSLGDQQPKYLNSPETTLFHKGSELYGLYETLQSCKPEHLIVVEGYLDVISLHQHGLTNAVATLGTAITNVQLEKIFREASHVIFCLDGDSAGQRAAWKALQLSLPKLTGDRQLEFSFLREGTDPDSLVREVGAEQFFHHSDMMSPSDFLVSTLEKEINSNSGDAKAWIVAKAKPFIISIPDGSHRVSAIRTLAKATGFDEKILWQEFQSNGGTRNASKTGARLSEYVKRPLSDQITAILLQYPSVGDKLEKPMASLFEEELPESNLLLAVWKAAIANNPNPAMLFERFRDSENVAQIKELASLRLPFSENEATEEFTDGIRRLEAKSKENIVKRINTLPFQEWTEEQKKLVREYKRALFSKDHYEK